MPLLESQWMIELSKEWDILGPFPIHAREQHFLEPSFPIDVKVPIDLNATYPSSYADGGQVTWSKARADKDSGILEVSFSESVRWSSLRDSEGWAALQHHAVLKTSLTVYPVFGSNSNSRPPHLRIKLVGGSYFTIISSNSTGKVPRWYAGNIYDMERALPRVVELPEAPSFDKPTTYDVFVSGDYEIRLFGDPRVQRNSDVPAQIIKLEVEFDIDIEQVVWEPTQDVMPDVVSGWTFGDAIGIGLRARDGWWSVHDAQITHSLKEFRLAPTQARILPLRIRQHKDLPLAFTSINVTLVLQRDDAGDTITLELSLAVTHVVMWDDPSPTSSNPVLKGSYFFGVSDSIPTNFLVVPPESSDKRRAPILALHGAGVDIFAPSPSESFWAQALPRQVTSWVVIPSGRTSWHILGHPGLDWHGPSAQDAWGVLDAVTDILQCSESTTWGKNKWGIPSAIPNRKPQAILMGHSNGGQGAWYIAERFPDRVLGVIPASAYVKSQAYVPWTMSRSAHFADPFLEAILHTSLTPDDNDLFVGNLRGKDVLAIHGGDDENVPVWHSRELVSVLQNLDGIGHNTSRVEFLEFRGQSHWFPTVFKNNQVQSFIDQLLDAVELGPQCVTYPETFSLTVAIPAESGSMRGWHVEKLSIPGRLGRVSVHVIEHSSSFAMLVNAETTNILEFSVDPELFASLKRHKLYTSRPSGLNCGKYLSDSWNTLQLSGRMQTVLSSYSSVDGSELMGSAPLVFVVPDAVLDLESGPTETPSHAMSIALRLSHDLLLYHRLDSEIMINSEVDIALLKPEFASAFSKGNVIVNKFRRGEQFHRRQRIYDKRILFLHPHPMNSCAKMLLLQSTEPVGVGLERAARLFPIRTGVPVPDWIIIGEDNGRGEGNVIAAGLWDSEWNWNKAMSWSSTM
ncbi:hypothetical protein F5876DRAFT_90994 [Lentinula aff. lateritia]|uniref:Uncharacterized protein n=1 Tax=Lentinula aff. lateritia TaxID=2804960 RepID=A0ACC1TPF0_9AGAR|nr:hypothetical protein F5876DRAFT_90994 [Lentinula aff. lateritia]